MMMHCLGLGGLPLAYDPSREEALREEQPHNPNEYFYELEIPKALFMSLAEYKGKCLKALGISALGRGAEPLKVIYMMRDPTSQFNSMKTACGMIEGNYIGRSFRILSKLQSSDEVESCLVLDYDSVLKNPIKSFSWLKANGWPIDVEKSASGVDPSRKHY